MMEWAPSSARLRSAEPLSRRRASQSISPMWIPEMAEAILVTGASKGIGRAIAQRLSADGHAVVVHYGRDRGGAEETLASIAAAGREARLLSFDISDREACRRVLEEDIAANGAPFGIVLNAGIS